MRAIWHQDVGVGIQPSVTGPFSILKKGSRWLRACVYIWVFSQCCQGSHYRDPDKVNGLIKISSDVLNWRDTDTASSNDQGQVHHAQDCVMSVDDWQLWRPVMSTLKHISSCPLDRSVMDSSSGIRCNIDHPQNHKYNKILVKMWVVLSCKTCHYDARVLWMISNAFLLLDSCESKESVWIPKNLLKKNIKKVLKITMKSKFTIFHEILHCLL